MLLGATFRHNVSQKHKNCDIFASRYLKQLTSIGVLSEIALGREKLFLHPKLLQLLTRDSNTFTDYP